MEEELTYSEEKGGKNAEINRINLQHVIIPPNYSLQNKTEKKNGKRKERKNNRNKSIQNVTMNIYTADFRSKVSKTKSKKNTIKETETKFGSEPKLQT